MYRTRITELLGIDYPILGGCMQYVSGPEFTAGISNAGALGIMSSAMFPTKEDFRSAVRRLKSLTDRPFAVNLNLFPALRPIDNEHYAEVIMEEEVPIVETSGNRPPEGLLSLLRGGGVNLLHKCASIRHALRAQRDGVDAVTLFGREGGGHISEEGYTTFSMIPRASEILDIPLVAAGGISDGRGLAAARALGADAVLIGTRLLLTVECPIHENIKRALVAATEQDTVLILGSVHNTLRAWKNEAAEKASRMEGEGADFDEILEVVAGANTRNMIERGEVDAGVLACSQAVGAMNEILPLAELLTSMTSEADSILNSGLDSVRDSPLTG